MKMNLALAAGLCATASAAPAPAPKDAAPAFFKKVVDLKDVNPLYGVSFSPDGKHLAVPGHLYLKPLQTAVARYDAPGWKKSGRPVQLMHALVTRWGPDSESLYVVCNSALIEMRRGLLVRHLASDTQYCSMDRETGAFDPPRNEFLDPRGGYSNSGSGAFALVPGGRYLLATEYTPNFPKGRSGVVDTRKFLARVYDVATGVAAEGFLTDRGPQGFVRFSPEGSRLAAYRLARGSGYPAVLAIWDTVSKPWKLLREVEVPYGPPSGVPSFSPDGRLVAAGGGLFEVETGVLVRDLNRMNAVFDPRGQFVITSNSNADGLTFLSPADWKEVGRLPLERSGTKNRIADVVLSEDGSTLAVVIAQWQGPRSKNFTRIYARQQ